jgi:hypothetical protein
MRPKAVLIIVRIHQTRHHVEDANGIQTNDGHANGGSCYKVGYNDEQNGDFSKNAFHDNCGSLKSDNEYYEGFINGY